jgi:protein-S-isoprenylcysteine O-methyltransferase Ste14
MTIRPQQDGDSSAERDVANPGRVRPPLVYLTSLIVGMVIQLAKPLPFLSETLAAPLGVPLIAVAIALFTYSVAKFRAAGTPVPARKPTTAIVRTGPYRFSRNPIYLAFSVFQFGIARARARAGSVGPTNFSQRRTSSSNPNGIASFSPVVARNELPWGTNPQQYISQRRTSCLQSFTSVRC